MKLGPLAALVPMRHTSERVPGKNYRMFAGLPLYEHIIRTLDGCPLVSRIVVDTDSPTIRDGLAAKYPSVLVIERPEHLRAGAVPMNDVLLHDVTQVDAEYFLQTHCTNPFLRQETVARAIVAFRSQYPAYDSLFSVTRLQRRLWDAGGRALNHDPALLLRTQDLPPVFEENSCLYVFTRHTLETRRNRLGERPQMFEIDRLEAWDIDDEMDFAVAELVALRQNAGGTDRIGELHPETGAGKP